MSGYANLANNFCFTNNSHHSKKRAGQFPIYSPCANIQYLILLIQYILLLYIIFFNLLLPLQIEKNRHYKTFFGNHTRPKPHTAESVQAINRAFPKESD